MESKEIRIAGNEKLILARNCDLTLLRGWREEKEVKKKTNQKLNSHLP